MNFHLDDADFAALLTDREPRCGTEAAHLHLLSCRRCKAAMFAYDDISAGLYIDRWYGPGSARAWRDILECPIEDLVPFNHAAALEADRALDDWDPNTWPLRMRNDPRFRSIDATMFLLKRARQWWQDNPRKAENVTTGVIRAVTASQWCPESLRLRLLAKAWAYLGNAQRILDKFGDAHDAFREANRLYAQSAGSKSLAGEILWLQGALYSAERKFDVAIQALEDATTLLPSSGGPTTQLDASITLANTYRQAGQLEESIQTLERIIDRNPPAMFPTDAYLATLQNLAMSYVQTGRIEEARAHLPTIKRLASEQGKFLNLVRVKWLEAEIYKVESSSVPGRRLLAATCFREVQSSFLTVGNLMDAALAGLSLAEMYLMLEDSAAAADVAEELIPIFRSKGIYREATAAGLIVVKSMRRKAATLAEIQELVAKMRRMRSL